MLKILNRKLKRLCSRLRWPIRRRSKPKLVIKKLGKSSSKSRPDFHKDSSKPNGSAAIHPNGDLGVFKSFKPIRIATFNAALFSMAPAIPNNLVEKSQSFDLSSESYAKPSPPEYNRLRAKSMIDRPKSILKQSPLHPSSTSTSDNLSIQQKFAKSKLRVSINLPDNEISLKRSGQLTFLEDGKEGVPSSAYSSSANNINTRSRVLKGKAPARSTVISLPTNSLDGRNRGSTRTILEVLKELDADILALQDVKAEEEKDMKPLSDLAVALGMNYVFAESWAPEYGNAVLSKWPIKRWKIQKIFDDSDFRNVLRATVEVPHTGEVNVHCTHLDYLDENWRMKQIKAIIQSNDGPNILAGGLNSLDESDYSPERWTDIVKYYEEMGKPTPKPEVIRFLKSKQYTDAKDFAGECESVVMIAKGQNVQGTCKYGTRVDYILASAESPYKFVPGSYSVFSSKGTSDHHIVKVDLVKTKSIDRQHQQQQHFPGRKLRQPKQKIVKITANST